MNVVTTFEQIKNNIAELERGRKTEEYQGLIKHGTCFLPYKSQIGLSFAPSRFVGYIDNKLATHADNQTRHGSVTNAAINQLLRTQPSTNEALEQAYVKFCGKIGVTPSKTGSFGCERKYWLTAEVSELLEDNAENEIAQNPNLTKTEKLQLANARIGQGAFRESLVAMWGSKCCVTGCNYVGILRASHIKPWRDSTNTERLDKFNGLLLSPNLDALFDKGLISFTDSGDVLISEILSADVRKALGVSIDIKVGLKSEHAKYMTWHREKVYADGVHRNKDTKSTLARRAVAVPPSPSRSRQRGRQVPMMLASSAKARLPVALFVPWLVLRRMTQWRSLGGFRGLVAANARKNRVQQAKTCHSSPSPPPDDGELPRIPSVNEHSVFRKYISH